MSRLIGELIKEVKEITSTIVYVESKLLKLPMGKIRASKSGTTWQYYLKDGKKPNGSYIKKEQKELAIKIIEREYYERFLKECYERKNLIDKLIENFNYNTLEKVFYNLPEGKRKCLSPIIMSDEEFVKKWEKCEYVGKALKKIKLYEKNGLVLGVNLLITYETSQEPFDSRIFDNMLRSYGLC